MSAAWKAGELWPGTREMLDDLGPGRTDGLVNAAEAINMSRPTHVHALLLQKSPDGNLDFRIYGDAKHTKLDPGEVRQLAIVLLSWLAIEEGQIKP